jgi:hypothetical protein
MSEQTVKQTWVEMGQLLAVAFPRWLIRRLTERGEGKGFVVKAIPFVIIFLSVASVANLATQAYNHHANYSSYMTGAGIAVLVPIAVLAAMLIEGKWSYAFWLMAVVFAGISGTIQYNIYHTTDALMSIAEAIAFGYGVPLSEVMLAVMEARLVIQKDEEKARAEAAQAAQVEAQRLQAQAEQRAADEAAKQAETERKAQIRRGLDEEAERLRKQQEFEARQMQEQREFELKLKLQEAEGLAKIEMERLKVEAKLAAKPASQMATQSATSQSNRPASQSTGYDDQMAMLTIYQSDPSLSDEKMAARIGKSKKTVQDLLADLVAKDVVHIEKSGRGKSVAVNGKFPAFKAGKM